MIAGFESIAWQSCTVIECKDLGNLVVIYLVACSIAFVTFLVLSECQLSLINFNIGNP